MKQCKSVILNNSPESVSYVYSPEQLAEIAALTDLRPGVAGLAELEKGELRDVEVLFSTWGMIPLTEAQLDAVPSLKAVFYAAGATDYFARPFLARGIKVFSAWKANALPVAEFCVAQIILGLKGFFHASRMLKSPDFWNHKLGSRGVYGETVALIGAGAISAHVQELLKSYHLNVVVVPSRKEKRTVSLEEVFRKALVISNHLPDRDDNVGVLNGEMFRSMRPGAVFLNTGRGRQVNEPEMIEVLEQRPDLTALLDVTYPEPPVAGSKLYTLPNVMLSPHIAGSMNDEVHRMSDYMIAEFKRYSAGAECLYEVKESMLMTS